MDTELQFAPEDLGPAFVKDLDTMRKNCVTVRAKQGRLIEFSGIVAERDGLARNFLTAAAALSSGVTTGNVAMLWRLAQEDLGPKTTRNHCASWLKTYFERVSYLNEAA